METAAERDSAERLIAAHPFDLLLLDISLNGKQDGREIAALARARFDCPILFITGCDLAETDSADLMRPADRFLRKPFKMDVVLAEVSKLLKVDGPTIVKDRNGRAFALRGQSSCRRRCNEVLMSFVPADGLYLQDFPLRKARVVRDHGDPGRRGGCGRRRLPLARDATTPLIGLLRLALPASMAKTRPSLRRCSCNQPRKRSESSNRNRLAT